MTVVDNIIAAAATWTVLDGARLGLDRLQKGRPRMALAHGLMAALLAYFLAMRILGQ